MRVRAKRWIFFPMLAGLAAPAVICAQTQDTTPRVLLNQAIESERLGRFGEAENDFREALKVLDALPASDRPEVAVRLDELDELTSGRKPRNAMVPSTVVVLNEWGNLLRIQGRHLEAERLLRRAIMIGERADGKPSLGLAISLSSLGDLYCNQDEPARAVPLLARALEIRENLLGPQDPLVAASLGNLADGFMRQRRLEEAESLYQRALGVLETATEYPFSLAATNFKLAELYFRYKKRDSPNLSKAEGFYSRSLAILEGHRINSHGLLGLNMSALAELYCAEGRYAEAEPLLIRALAVEEKTLGPEHLHVADVLTTYAAVLRKLHRGREAAALDKRAKIIRNTFITENHVVRDTVDVKSLQPAR